MSKTYEELKNEELKKRATLAKRVKAGYILSIVFSGLSLFGLSIDTILGDFKTSDINTYVTAIAGIVCGAIFLNLSLKTIERGEKKIYLGVMGIIFGFIFAGVCYLCFTPSKFEDLYNSSSDNKRNDESNNIKIESESEIDKSKEEKIENIESNLSNTKNEELEVLKELYEKGVITEDEYNDKKERLLSK